MLRVFSHRRNYSEKEKVRTHATVWMKLGNTRPRERSQTQEASCRLSHGDRRQLVVFPPWGRVSRATRPLPGRSQERGVRGCGLRAPQGTLPAPLMTKAASPGSPADGALLPGKAEAQSRKMPLRPSFICGLARSLINSVLTECLPHGLPTVAGTEDRASSKTTPALPPHPVSRDAQAQSCPRALRPRVGEHVRAVVACGGPR